MERTLRLDDELLREAEAVAAASGKTLSELVEEALRERLAKQPQETSHPVILSTFKGDGLRPGVDLDTPLTSSI